ncbi:hypothetical protein RvY_13016-2 [Ramazzottius varieornatus]|nr:hypothetical protein RvY_13016-2 [Ramazzottius varieornatus]
MGFTVCTALCNDVLSPRREIQVNLIRFLARSRHVWCSARDTLHVLSCTVPTASLARRLNTGNFSKISRILHLSTVASPVTLDLVTLLSTFIICILLFRPARFPTVADSETSAAICESGCVICSLVLSRFVVSQKLAQISNCEPFSRLREHRVCLHR